MDRHSRPTRHGWTEPPRWHRSPFIQSGLLNIESRSEIISGLRCPSRSIAPMPKESWPADVVVMGGCGRVGLPLGFALANSGLKVALYDVNLSRRRPGGVGQDAPREPGAPEVWPGYWPTGTPCRPTRRRWGRPST